MPLRATSMAAAIAALLSTNPAAAQEPQLDLVLQTALSRYSGRGLPLVCERGNGCAVGNSVAAQLGVRVAEGFDVVLKFREVWADHPSRIYEPSVGVAWWPSEGVFTSRITTAVGLVVAPGTVGFDAHIGGELMVFPVIWFGLGLAGEIGPVGWLGGSSLKTSHVGAVVHLRL
jgi:hypothetical protein